MTKYMNLPTYKYIFNEKTGYFVRWGEAFNDDPECSPIGPEILDIETSEVCQSGNCPYCYKSNTDIGRNMSLDTFKKIIDKMPSLLQIAIGIGDLNGNEDLENMLKYARSKGIVPNLTINGRRLTDEWVNILSTHCGAVAVSNYGKNSCYGSVKKLTDAGMEQINIHQLVSEETVNQAWELIYDIEKGDERLSKLNAVVFLSLKQRGRGVGYRPLSISKFSDLVNYCLDKKIPIGFDSCTANKFLSVVKNRPEYDKLVQMAEPCESGLFSSYINVEGKFYPCSFTEEGEGLDVVNCNNFLDDIWNHPNTIEWRNKLLQCNRSCPVYNV